MVARSNLPRKQGAEGCMVESWGFWESDTRLRRIPLLRAEGSSRMVGGTESGKCCKNKEDNNDEK